MKRKISSCNIVRHPNMHMYAQYGYIITNYVVILAITLVVWPKSHEISNMIAQFEKVFWRYLKYSKFDIFIVNMSHNMTPCEGFTLFRSFLNFLCPFQLLSKRWVWRFLARDRASLNLQWISDEISYCETENNFSKKSWASDNVPVVQIWPTSYWFGRICLFHEEWAERFKIPRLGNCPYNVV